MADKKITQLTNITGANLVDADEFVVVDISADETKAITLGELKEAFDSGSGFVRITGDTMTGDLALSGADVTFGDNDKAIFGAGSDLQIYHDGSNSYIKDAGTGDLRIWADSPNISTASGNKIFYGNSGYAELYAAGGAIRLATTSTGIDVTGTASADQLNSKNGKLFLDDNGSHNGVINAPASLFINFDSDNTSASESVVFGYDRDGTSGGTSVVTINSTGIDVTGAVTADGLTVDGTATLSSLATLTGAAPRIEIYESDTTDFNGRIDSSGAALNLKTIADDGGSQKTRIKIGHSTGDISFYDSQGSSQSFFWDASAESLGIGTSSIGGSVSTKLHLMSGTTSSPTVANDADELIIEGSGSSGMTFLSTTASNIRFGDAADSSVGQITYTHSDNALLFGTNNTEAMRIDSSGRLGLKTTANNSFNQVGGADLFVLGSGAGSQGMTIYSGNTGVGSIAFADGTTTSNQYEGLIQYNHGTNSMAIYSNHAEAMRIDSSGNLLVGTTNTDPASNNVYGVALRPDGYATSITGEGGIALRLNRKANDGDIVEFRKDGSTVGSIGNISGDNYIGNSNTDGILFGTSGGEPAIHPMNGRVKVNGQGLLGTENSRWKDLFLSGGVYLGGVGSANKLEDYEEGTWTPTATNYNGTMTVVSSDYTKTGRMVFVKARLTFDGTSDADNFQIAGLPFSVNSTKRGGGFTIIDPSGSINSFSYGGATSIYGRNSSGTIQNYNAIGANTIEFWFFYEAS